MSAVDAARDFAAALDLDARVNPFRDRCWTRAAGDWPVLHLEDVSAIPFLTEIPGVEQYQHRARVRAADRDLYATVTAPDVTYEAYCRRALQLGGAQRVAVDGENSPLAIARGCGADRPLSQLVDVARAAGGLTIHPYMATEAVWELAARVASAAAVRVAVLGPPPPVTWIANDKALFAALVERVLGPGWMPAAEAATTVEGCAAGLRRLAARHTRIGLKRVRCASGTGNLILDAADVRSQAPAATQSVVRDFLRRTEWRPPEAVMVVAWETAASSPSTQWWIPPAADGAPRLDGIYEQILAGAERTFVGSRPSTLPARANAVLGASSRQVAAALQALGYVGRCSFDHLVLGDPAGDFTVRFTECNGRWGGTSTPMHLVDRVVRGPRPAYRAQDFVQTTLRGMPFGEVLARVGDAAFDAGTQRGRYIFYNVGPLADWGKLDVIALGASPEDAVRAMLDELPRLLGIDAAVATATPDGSE